jgi:Rad51
MLLPCGGKHTGMSLPISAPSTEQPAVQNPWVLSSRALTVFYGCPEMPRLSHYFLPRLLFAKKQILYLDGANQISPLLLARFARERGLDSSSVNSLIRVARAFTCFQLTELIRRVPKELAKFSADVLIVTALPDLYFDEDVQDRPARASFEHALEGLQQLAPLQLSIAVFSDATSFKTKRHDFFKKLRNQADHILKVESGPESSLSFTREKNTPLLSA